MKIEIINPQKNYENLTKSIGNYNKNQGELKLINCIIYIKKEDLENQLITLKDSVIKLL